MGITEDVRSRVETILNAEWNARSGQVVPHSTDVALSNGAVEIEAAFLYADLAESTALQKKYLASFAAKAIRMYLGGSSAIIQHFGGSIRSFDGDRVMGVFVGDSKRNDAVKAAFMINWLVDEVINPLVKKRHEANNTQVWVAQHGVGIDVGSTFIARAGVRNSGADQARNDLIFTGRAPNIAAKLSALRDSTLKSIIITKEVFDGLNDEQKRFLKSERAVWASTNAYKVGPYTLDLYHTGYWRNP